MCVFREQGLTFKVVKFDYFKLKETLGKSRKITFNCTEFRVITKRRNARRWVKRGKNTCLITAKMPQLKETNARKNRNKDA